MSRYYPALLNLADMPCLVVGGGRIAERKVFELLECDAKVTLISPEISDTLETLGQRGRIFWLPRNYQRGDCSGFRLVISATDHKELNRSIAKECKEQGILVNVVDDPGNCSFIMPAVLRRGDLVIAVSTGGASPLVARDIRRDLENRYGQEYAEYLQLLSEARTYVLSTVSDQVERRKIFERLTDGRLLQLLQDGKVYEAKEWVNQCLSYR